MNRDLKKILSWILVLAVALCAVPAGRTAYAGDEPVVEAGGHVFGDYEVDGAKVTVNCVAPHDLPCEQALTLTLTPPAENTFNGSPVSVGFAEGETEKWTAYFGEGSLPKIEYYIDSELLVDTADGNSGSAGPGQAPVDAGTYYAAVFPSKDDPDMAAVLQFTIVPKALAGASIGTNFADDTAVYTGSVISPVFTVKDGNTVLTEGIDYTIESSVFGIICDEYTVDITYVGNYKGKDEFTWQIVPRLVELNWGSTEFVYNGESQVPTAEISNIAKGNNVSVVVTGARVNAGTNYTATASELQGSDKEQYRLPDVKPVCSFSISPMLLDNITASTDLIDNTAVYTGSTVTPTVTVMNGETPLTADTDYKLSGDTSAALPGDNYKITVTLTSNYMGGTEVPWKIEKKTLSVSDFDYIPPLSLVYDGDSKDAGVVTKDGVEGVGIPSMSYKQGETSVEEPVNAGVYDVYVETEEGDYYKAMAPSKIASFTVDPRVTLQQGGEIIYTADTADLEGNFSFGDQVIEVGIYDLVLETGEKTVSKMVKYDKDSQSPGNIEIPEEKIKTNVETMGKDTPKVIVDGLTELAKEKAVGGKSVEIKLTAEKLEESMVPKADKEALAAAIGNRSVEIEYMGIQLTENIDGKAGTITDTGAVLISMGIVLPSSDDLKKGALNVFRIHDTESGKEVTRLDESEKTDAKEDTYSKDKNWLLINSKKFSVYAIVYEADEEETPVSVYSVNTGETVNGTVAADRTSAEAGETVTLTVTPDKGWTLETLTVTDRNGRELEVDPGDDGRFTFRMPSGKVTVNATFMENNAMLSYFVDVTAADDYYDAVLWAASNGVTLGVDSLHFAPEQGTTRAQMITFIWRAAGCPEPAAAACAFTDVKAGSFYEKAVLWGVEKGIVKGTTETTFSPDLIITVGQAKTFLARMSGEADPEANLVLKDACPRWKAVSLLFDVFKK